MLRFEDHMHTKVVDVQFVYSAQSLDRLKKKRNKYLDKLERAEITYQRRKQKQERREQAKSQDVGFWDGYRTLTCPVRSCVCGRACAVVCALTDHVLCFS
jgi:hypothetical protein